MNLSIIIPTLNEAVILPRLLEDLATQSRPVDEVILVDGNSSDDTQRIFQTWAATHPSIQTQLLTSQRDVGTQRNRGARVASGELLCFVDADTQLPETFVETGFAHIADSDAAIWCPQFWPDRQLPHLLVFYAVFNTIFWLSSFTQRPAGGGMCIWVDASVFETYDFPESQHFEDLTFIRTVGGQHGYAVLPNHAIVSTRRFQKDGWWQTLWTYTQLSWRFVRRQTLSAVGYGYEFHDNSKES